jgi:hypothetical protein
VGSQEVYFEAATDAEMWHIVDAALCAIKEFIDYEKF